MRSLVIMLLLVSLVASADKAKPPGKGFWKILVKPNAKWTLRDRFAEQRAKEGEDKAEHVSVLTIETYDVRKVGDADVARLRWRLDGGKDDAFVHAHMPDMTQVAVTRAGLYMLSDTLDDAGVAEALKQKPSRSDPPKSYKGTKRNAGRYLEIKGDQVCMGEQPLPDEHVECQDTCFGTVCISGTEGIVYLDGNYSPNESEFDAASQK